MGVQNNFRQVLVATEIPLAAIAPPNFYSNQIFLQNNIHKTEPQSYSYPVDQIIKIWNEEKYLPSTTTLGKIFDYITGWTLNDEGKPNPSIFSRIKNYFNPPVIHQAKPIKEITLEENKTEEEFTPGASITIDDDQTSGTFTLNYWKDSCRNPSVINGKWELYLEAISKSEDKISIDSIDDKYHKSVINCLVKIVVQDFFNSYANYCYNPEFCGCFERPSDININSEYPLFGKGRLIVNTNENTARPQIMETYKGYPYPSKTEIDYCFESNNTYYNLVENQDVTVFVVSILGMTIVTTIPMVLYIYRLMKKKPSLNPNQACDPFNQLIKENEDVLREM